MLSRNTYARPPQIDCFVTYRSQPVSRAARPSSISTSSLSNLLVVWLSFDVQAALSGLRVTLSLLFENGRSRMPPPTSRAAAEIVCKASENVARKLS